MIAFSESRKALFRKIFLIFFSSITVFHKKLPVNSSIYPLIIARQMAVIEVFSKKIDKYLKVFIHNTYLGLSKWL